MLSIRKRTPPATRGRPPASWYLHLRIFCVHR